MIKRQSHMLKLNCTEGFPQNVGLPKHSACEKLCDSFIGNLRGVTHLCFSFLPLASRISRV